MGNLFSRLFLCTRRNCRKMSGTSGEAGGNSLGKPLHLACHLASVDSGWCSKSCKVDLRERLHVREKKKTEAKNATDTRERVGRLFFTTRKNGEEDNRLHELYTKNKRQNTHSLRSMPPLLPHLAEHPKVDFATKNQNSIVNGVLLPVKAPTR